MTDLHLRVLGDDDIEPWLTPARTRAWVSDALAAHTFGELIAPARTQAAIGHRSLRLTAGQVSGNWFGFRSYLAPGDGRAQEVTVVYDDETMHVRGLHVGTALAPRRCGAIGAVALEALAPGQASRLALIGTGTQAWHQLWALADVRTFADITVYSRDPARRSRFAARARDELGLPARAVGSAREAVTDAPIVVLATHSSTPVIEASWLAPGAYLSTVGPKQVGHHEFGLDLLERIGTAVTDSLHQVAAYSPPNILTTTSNPPCLLSLGDVLWRGLPELASTRGPGDLTTFFSVGLGGSEVYLLERVLDALDT
ncbi:MAG: hypothetical protein Q4P32_02690 [Micrococcales bacterium]|nr:hypothetical protein [Micrococcales bacterium]